MQGDIRNMINFTERQTLAQERAAAALERIANSFDRVAGNLDLITDQYVGDVNSIKQGDFDNES